MSGTLSVSELQALSIRQDGPGLRRMSLHLLVLVATASMILVADSVFLLGPALLVHGIVMMFLFAPLHESVHRTAFRTPALNTFAGLLGGLVLVLPPEYFRHFHMAHHRYTQDPERDPELRTRKPCSTASYLYILSGAEYWRRSIVGLLGRALGRVPSDIVPESRRRAVVNESRYFLAVYGIAAAGSLYFSTGLVFWLWVCPAVLGQPFLRAFLLAEHWGCPPVDAKWHNTRSTDSNRLTRLLAWNMPYHAEHHAYAGVPFHALPKLSRMMADARVVVSPGYGRFHRREVPELINRGDGV